MADQAILLKPAVEFSGTHEEVADSPRNTGSSCHLKYSISQAVDFGVLNYLFQRGIPTAHCLVFNIVITAFVVVKTDIASQRNTSLTA